MFYFKVLYAMQIRLYDVIRMEWILYRVLQQIISY